MGASGSRPHGNTGTLSDTPMQLGTFPISVTAVDQFNQKSPSANFNVVITPHGFAATGSMATARRFHTATLLSNGKVLVAGGEDSGSNAFDTAELYDPATAMFTQTTHNRTTPRAGHTATLLGTGKVLITGGDVIFYNGIPNSSILSLASAELFDPGAGTFTKTGSMTVPRESHTATLFTSGPDAGKVLITAGSNGTLCNPTPAAILYATSEIFDPSRGTFTASGTMTTERDLQTANLLGSGKFLVADGESKANTQASVDLFDPAAGAFAATGAMTEPRFYHDASTLSDGTVLVTGGSDDSTGQKPPCRSTIQTQALSQLLAQCSLHACGTARRSFRAARY